MHQVLTENAIKTLVRELASKINQDYSGKKICFVGVLKGAFIFLSDLVKRIDVPCEIEFVQLSSYKNSETAGCLELLSKEIPNVEGKHVILVDEIVDTGNTLSWLKKEMLTQNPKSVKVCALLDKGYSMSIHVDYCGIIYREPGFLVGYGLDDCGFERNHPFIYEKRV